MTRRRGSANYYARIGIPKELQAHYGRREIWRSLRTTDPAAARRLARPFIERWEIEFEQLRQRRMLTERDLQEAVWDRYAELIQADERFRQTLPTDADLDVIWKALEEEFEPYDLRGYRILEYVQDRFAENQRERHQRTERLRGHAARGETMLGDEVVRLDVDKRRLDVLFDLYIILIYADRTGEGGERIVTTPTPPLS